MPDYFALLNKPRRPWLDADLLKQKFLALASDLHPDRVHNASEAEKSEATKRYAELNAVGMKVGSEGEEFLFQRIRIEPRTAWFVEQDKVVRHFP